MRFLQSLRCEMLQTRYKRMASHYSSPHLYKIPLHYKSKKIIMNTTTITNNTANPIPIFLMITAAFLFFFSKKNTGNPKTDEIMIHTNGKKNPSTKSFTFIPHKKNHNKPHEVHITSAIATDVPRANFLFPSSSDKPNSL